MVPVFVLAFHPVHKLQALALIVVTGCEFDGKCILIMTQVDTIGFVQCLIEQHLAMILVTCNHFFLADKQLGQHHAWQVFLLSPVSM